MAIRLRLRQALLALMGAVLLALPVWAVDVPNRNAPPEHRSMREARALIAEKRWAQAERVLAAHAVAEPQDADAHNLLGFSLRNLGRLEESLVAYRRALALDPAHLGAHEYIGEAYVQLGDLARGWGSCSTGSLARTLSVLRARELQSEAGRPGLMRSMASRALMKLASGIAARARSPARSSSLFLTSWPACRARFFSAPSNA
jgi:tetratricopeptide (TPR) repeat protein